MSDLPIKLPRPIVNRLLQAAQAGGENEVCGLIGARDGSPVSVYPVPNVATNKSILFRMEPQRQIAAVKTMRERGEELYAIWHTHPGAPPTPSQADFDEAAYPDALYLIISLDTKGVLEMRGFRLQATGFTETPVSI